MLKRSYLFFLTATPSPQLYPLSLHDALPIFFPAVMRPVVKFEVSALLGTLDAPAGENACDVDHVLLRVAAVDAQGMQLQELPGIVLIDPFGHAPHPLTPSPPCGEGERG